MPPVKTGGIEVYYIIILSGAAGHSTVSWCHLSFEKYGHVILRTSYFLGYCSPREKKVKSSVAEQGGMPKIRGLTELPILNNTEENILLKGPYFSDLQTHLNPNRI